MAFEQRSTPLEGATEQHVDELHSQLHRTVPTFERGYYVHIPCNPQNSVPKVQQLERMVRVRFDIRV